MTEEMEGILMLTNSISRRTNLFISIGTTVTVILWAAIPCFMLEPIEHLYARGYGRLSAVLFLLLLPLLIAASSAFITLWLKRRNQFTLAVITPVISLLAWMLYVSFLVVGMSI
jgi:hypothetical protein